MHVDREPRSAAIGDEAEDGTVGLVGFKDETVFEIRESTSVNVGKRKRKQQEKKQSRYFLVMLIMLYCSISCR